jgi:methanogenic corrinoid protein MtbC1
MRRIAEALARGHRASQVVPASDAQLAQLLAVGSLTLLPPPLPSTESFGPADVDRLLAVATRPDPDALRSLLLADWAALGALRFLEDRIAPLLRGVGTRWSDGSLEVGHEHLVSARIGDMLRLFRGPFEERAQGPLIVLATLPGELHELGLLMAALVLATAGCRTLYLGTDTPVGQIATLATETGARAVALSVSEAARTKGVRRLLASLRRRLRPPVLLVVGGAGAPSGSTGVARLDTLADLQEWARQLRA